MNLVAVAVLVVLLGFLVLVHEFGHFLAAKLLGLKVRKFSIGFGPKLLEFKKWGTKFSIRALLFGGYVDIKEEGKNSLQSLGLIGRGLVVLGGVIANFVVAILLSGVFLYAKGYKVESLGGEAPLLGEMVVEDRVVVITRVMDNPDLKSKLPQNCICAIQKVGDTPITSAKHLISVISHIPNNGAPLPLTLKDLTTGKTFTITTQLNSKGKLGVEIVDLNMVYWSYTKLPVYPVTAPFAYTIDLSWVSAKFVYTLIRQAIQTQDTALLAESVGGPVALYGVVDYMVESKQTWYTFLQLTALVSLNLALVNLLPIPPLDGWQLVYVTLQRFFPSKKLNIYLKYLTYLGFFLLILLSILITIKDIKMFL